MIELNTNICRNWIHLLACVYMGWPLAVGYSCTGLSGRAPSLLGILDGFGLDKELLIGITSINQTLGLPCLYMYMSFASP